MWSWLQENHPLLYEVIWMAINLMSLAAIIISLIVLIGKG